MTNAHLESFDYFNTPISAIHTSNNWWTLCNTDGGDDRSESWPPCSYLKLSSQQQTPVATGCQRK